MTDGELLYSCLLKVRPLQFAEGTAGVEPRTPWVDLTERSQWTREDWERIAAMFLCTGESTGKALYACAVKVVPDQRRQAGHTVPRPRWEAMGWRLLRVGCEVERSRQEEWDLVAREFVRLQAKRS